jgi:hypothetical protein
MLVSSNYSASSGGNMRRLLAAAVLFAISVPLSAQKSLATYTVDEWQDFFHGLTNLSRNHEEAYSIYNDLRDYSGHDYRVVYGQTFQWGQAHPGGVIILDVSTLQKPRDVLAFVFAHEWAHEALGHQPNIYNPYGSTWKIRQWPTQDEDEADYYAGGFLQAKGYDVEAVTEYLRDVPVVAGDYTHSTGVVRARTVVAGANGGSRPARTAIRVDCTHGKACEHLMACVHQIPCSHATACSHQMACTHTAPCSHTMACSHTMPCQHVYYTPYGPQVMHPYDTMHAYDSAHPYDQAHPFDTMHTADAAHPYDTLHMHDSAHPFDLIHAYDEIH